MVPRFFGHDHLTVEFGQVVLDRVVQPKLAFIHQHHTRGGGHWLGHRGNPEQSVFGHRRLGGHVGVADRYVIFDRIIRAHEYDRTGQDSTINVALQPGRHGPFGSLDRTRGDAQGHRQREHSRRNGCVKHAEDSQETSQRKLVDHAFSVNRPAAAFGHKAPMRIATELLGLFNTGPTLRAPRPATGPGLSGVRKLASAFDADQSGGKPPHSTECTAEAKRPTRLDRSSIFAKSAAIPQIHPFRLSPSGEKLGRATATACRTHACRRSSIRSRPIAAPSFPASLT